MIIAKDMEIHSTKHENRNTIVIGSPGTGKTRNIILPSILTETGSMVILDPKGELYDMTSSHLEEKGYIVKMINFGSPCKSTVHYNPLNYISSEDDICKIAELLANNCKGIDQFWIKSSKLLFEAIIGYLIAFTPGRQRTLESVRRLLSAANACFSVENEITNVQGKPFNGRCSKLDRIFNEVIEKCPESWALKQYTAVTQSENRTMASIVITALADFAEVLTPEIVKIISDDTLDIRSMAHNKTALFVCSSDIDRSKDILTNLLFTQLFQELYNEADISKEHCLQVPVTFYMDDYGCNLNIERFDCIAASSRGRGIALVPILQSIDQLKKSAPNTYTAILNSMNNMVFLGGNDLETCRDISLRLNCPLEDVLYKPKDEIYVFMQGQKPIRTKCFNVTQISQYKQVQYANATIKDKNDISMCA